MTYDDETYQCDYCRRFRHESITYTLLGPHPCEDRDIKLCEVCERDRRHESPGVSFWIEGNDELPIMGVCFLPGREYDPVDVVKGGATEEGYNHVHERYELIYNEEIGEWIVTLETTVDSRDCDGRYLQTFYNYARLEELAGRDHSEYPEFKVPFWHRSTDQEGFYRDFTAESMNY